MVPPLKPRGIGKPKLGQGQRPRKKDKMGNRDNYNGMKYKILVKRITDLYPPYGTWEEWLRTDKAESAQQMVLHLERQGHEAQSVLIGQSATPEAQADLDETAAIQEATMERMRKELLAKLS